MKFASAGAARAAADPTVTSLAGDAARDVNLMIEVDVVGQARDSTEPCVCRRCEDLRHAHHRPGLPASRFWVRFGPGKRPHQDRR